MPINYCYHGPVPPAKAKEVIEAGAVQADGMAVQKVSQLIAPDAKTIQSDLLRWVSLGP